MFSVSIKISVKCIVFKRAFVNSSEQLAFQKVFCRDQNSNVKNVVPERGDELVEGILASLDPCERTKHNGGEERGR